jgi:hypothetical protein
VKIDPIAFLNRLLVRRQEAENTLKDPGIVSAIEELRTKALQAIESSSPHAIEDREHMYAFLRGLRGIEEVLHRRIQAHKDEEKRQARANDPNRPTRGIVD